MSSEDRINPIKYPFSDVEKSLRDLTIPNTFDQDSHAHNFMLGEDGGEYYVDNLLHFRDYLDNYLLQCMGSSNKDWFNPQVIDSYMASHKYSMHDRRVASMCVQRLRTVFLKEKTA